MSKVVTVIDVVGRDALIEILRAPLV